MKQKIFEQLRTSYSHLGLGDSILNAVATSLAGAGLVNDENLASVVLAQKDALEAMQKANDKRAADAARKASDDAEKRAKDEVARLESELSALKLADKPVPAEQETKPTDPAPTEPANSPSGTSKSAESVVDEIPEWYKKQSAEQRAQLKAILDKNAELSKSINKLQTENDAFKAKQAAEQRSAFISAKAKELGVPQWRVDEGFSIAADADEAQITDYITTVANNVKANLLPTEGVGFPHFTGDVKKEDMDALAEKLLR